MKCDKMVTVEVEVDVDVSVGECIEVQRERMKVRVRVSGYPEAVATQRRSIFVVACAINTIILQLMQYRRIGLSLRLTGI